MRRQNAPCADRVRRRAQDSKRTRSNIPMCRTAVCAYPLGWRTRLEGVLSSQHVTQCSNDLFGGFGHDMGGSIHLL